MLLQKHCLICQSFQPLVMRLNGKGRKSDLKKNAQETIPSASNSSQQFCPGSPFLANEDGVLGGVIVLRSCRCSAEPESSQEKPTLLGKEFLLIFNSAGC